MSQMPQLSACPSCEEPLESGDLYCGACGFDLSAVPPRPAASPNGAAKPAATEAMAAADATDATDATDGESARWPVAPDADSSDLPVPPHLPTDLAGTDSAGGELSGAAVPATGAAAPAAAGAAAPAAGAAEEPDEYPLPAPADPRTEAPDPTPAAGTKLCVACRSGRVDPDGYCENCGHAQPRERDHMEQELGTVAAVSDRGLRHHRNEDAFAISEATLPDGSPAVVAIVCDGVSSATRPDEASLAASRAADASLLAGLERGSHPQQAMHDAILAAADAVNALAAEPAAAREHSPHQNAPACTLVGAVVAGGLLVVGWVGDSRAYWVPDDRGGPTVRLTEDDSWAAQMVAAGLMNEAEAYADERAHAITGWLGADAYELEPHTASFKPDRAGVVVVCTDGLWNYAEGVDEMADAVPADSADRPLHSAQVLVGHALDGGGHDNVTVAVVPFPFVPQGAGSA
ncbi:PP2C family serine/threonine-protein phosphatase [Streptomyces sp. NPDC046465]|uniref:PP2C family protein-serine/threonine phosphatase n=1 Tax=Streptomyces sp. NPDC046465 TaxID=3155810 RepID=UPI0033EB0265